MRYQSTSESGDVGEHRMRRIQQERMPPVLLRRLAIPTTSSRAQSALNLPSNSHPSDVFDDAYAFAVNDLKHLHECYVIPQNFHPRRRLLNDSTMITVANMSNAV